MSGLLWCVKHNCSITGSGNKIRRYYVCESLRRHGRKESDCPSIKKEALEHFILDLLKQKIFTLERISDGLKYLINTKQTEETNNQNELASLKARIAKLMKEIDGLNQGMIDSGLYPQSTMKLVAEREIEISELKKQLSDIKENKSHTVFNFSGNEEKTVRDIQQQIYGILDNESPDNQRGFLRYYIDKIKISGDSMDIYFKFHDSPDNSQELVAGVGFEPTTFGL